MCAVRNLGGDGSDGQTPGVWGVCISAVLWEGMPEAGLAGA
jgi:hypothetical protein